MQEILPTSQFLREAISPIAEVLGLPTLPNHIHQLLGACLFYHIVCSFFSPYVSKRLFPGEYLSLDRRTKYDWDVHVTSLVQAVLITGLSLHVILNDEEMENVGWVGRIWGYTPAGGFVQAMAAGYFLWDLGVSGMNVGMFGWGALAHAVCALGITMIGFRPFANYYGLRFILYEISTPFVDFHWFMETLKLENSPWQVYNGACLLLSFFSCRILWGNLQSFMIYADLWKVISGQGLAAENIALVQQLQVLKYRNTLEDTTLVLPPWLVLIYLASNTLLTFLNFYWFSIMARTAWDQLKPSKTQEDLKERKKV